MKRCRDTVLLSGVGGIGGIVSLIGAVILLRYDILRVCAIRHQISLRPGAIQLK